MRFSQTRSPVAPAERRHGWPPANRGVPFLSPRLGSAIALLGCLLLVGCAGSSSGISSREGTLSISAEAVAGPVGGGAGFALALRAAEGEGSDGTTTQRYEGRLVINGTVLARVSTLGISALQDRVTFSATVPLIPGPTEFALELLPASHTAATSPLLKGYYRVNVNDAGITVATVTLNAGTTAKALAYEAWRQRPGPTLRNISQFTGDVSALSGLVQAWLNTRMTTNIIPGADFTWGEAIIREASRVADLAPMPGTGETGVLDLAEGALELFYDREWLVTSPPDSVPSVPGSVVGITFFKLPPNNLPTLGNWFRYHPRPQTTADQTPVIAYLPEATSLDDVASAPATFYPQALDRYPFPTALAEGQVYAFHVGDTYGALQITQIAPTTSITFRYKYNRRPGDPRLR
ncbi:MAG: hypothetical protein OZSIB_3151 [Candidatus Ozemobacter sibiricus]|uniref:Uncharacterized protein n=1 Tax=Candidatus Ozemobacter sibiricus TaxID=2268124 RepID=A0A367ZQI9_9BACT|nr:MAG: hypothetical protein OZSIB_3151 [Candidatus Ozemobacter sibiricus]